ncbi:MAG: hypothetical protein IJA23_02020 [Clostridia bacterium]|nr:hypothetical protein [Clostridia bacterium]
MKENSYKNLSDELIVIETQNIISEIKAFLHHDIISERKYTQLETKVYEISRELENRVKFLGEDAESVLTKNAVLGKVEQLNNLLQNLKKRVQSQPQPQ